MGLVFGTNGQMKTEILGPFMAISGDLGRSRKEGILTRFKPSCINSRISRIRGESSYLHGTLGLLNRWPSHPATLYSSFMSVPLNRKRAFTNPDYPANCISGAQIFS